VSMRAELTRLHQRYRTTTIYVTHDQVEAMTLGDRIAVLDKGRLQQVGTSEELYFRPANVFVAGFMGSPSMNMTDAEVSDDGGLTVVVDGNHWPVPGRTELTKYNGKKLVLGLRPDAFVWPPADGPRVTVKALAVESLGSEKHVLFAAPGARGTVGSTAGGADENLWTAKVSQRCAVGIGDQVVLGIDLSSAYFFDADSGLALPAPQPEPQPEPRPAPVEAMAA
jgi:multiple sugar transport system ATP-binding protein